MLPAPLPADEFLAEFGDVLDDRVAEVVDELLDQRAAQLRRSRLRPALLLATLVLAVAASIVLRHNAVAVCTVWPSAAAIYIAASRAWIPRLCWPDASQPDRGRGRGVRPGHRVLRREAGLRAR
ncbi:MAG TPA: hypothetical protein VGH88_04350 [Streptosporangiaceae bacterium]